MSSMPPGTRALGSIGVVGASRIHHVGMAVQDLERAVMIYERLFRAEVEHRERLDSQGVDAVLVRVGEDRVELLASLGADTPVGKFLTKRGPGVHHVAYEVADLRAELATLAEDGVELIDSEPQAGLYGLQVAFVHPDAVCGVLTELVSGG
jgi:methylmalonyl-CoA/ethylmalonyl-CoA epimerase